jgi:putative intracellular protease/amidase
VKVAIVCISTSNQKGFDTEVWMDDLSAPYYIFTLAGYDVILASPAGGPIPIDTGSITDPLFTESSRRFLHDHVAMGMMNHSIKVDSIDWSNTGDVGCIFLAGGHGTCVDYIDNPALKHAVETMYADGKVVASVCSGAFGLCDFVKPDGTPLVFGKKVTFFSYSEEHALQLQSLAPYLLESKLKELGGNSEKAEDWHPKCCIDDKLVTGLNPQSSDDVAL